MDIQDFTTFSEELRDIVGYIEYQIDPVNNHPYVDTTYKQIIEHIKQSQFWSDKV